MNDNKNPIVFVCHASEDEHFVSALMNLLMKMGISKKSIVCTSMRGCGLKNGENWNDQLREKFTDYNPYVIIIHSRSLYKSAVAMNEMGAAWVLKHKVFSFLVKGLEVKDMKGVFSSTHQATLVSQSDISEDIDQLYDALLSHLQLQKLDNGEWENIRGVFIEKIKAIPDTFVSNLPSEAEFDINETIEIQMSSLVDYFSDETHTESVFLTIGDLLKETYHVLSIPQTEYALREYLENKYVGITDDCRRMIQGKLHMYGLIDVQQGQTDDGPYVAWSLSTKGRKAYEMASGYAVPKWQIERDRKTMKTLFKAFSTNSMDDYLQEGPDYVDSILLTSADMWRSMYTASSTHIYQDSLKRVLDDFVKIWFVQMAHGELYMSCNNRYKLQRNFASSCTDNARKTITLLKQNMKPLHDAYHNLIMYVNKAFPEFDLGAWSAEFEQELNRNIC